MVLVRYWYNGVVYLPIQKPLLSHHSEASQSQSDVHSMTEKINICCKRSHFLLTNYFVNIVKLSEVTIICLPPIADIGGIVPSAKISSTITWYKIIITTGI